MHSFLFHKLHVIFSTDPVKPHSGMVLAWKLEHGAHTLLPSHTFPPTSMTNLRCSLTASPLALEPLLGRTTRRKHRAPSREMAALGKAAPLLQAWSAQSCTSQDRGSCVIGLKPLWELRGSAYSAALEEVPGQGCYMLGLPQVKGSIGASLWPLGEKPVLLLDGAISSLLRAHSSSEKALRPYYPPTSTSAPHVAILLCLARV